MLELTTLFIFTWLTLRVRYFHTYFKDWVVFDLNLNDNALVRWLSSFVITSETNVNRNSRERNGRGGLLTLTSNQDTMNNENGKNNGIARKNLMRFRKIIPIEESQKPHPRSGHRAIVTDSDLWIWGGYYPATEERSQQMFKELWRFNFALRRWTLEKTTGNDPGQALASHSMCLFRHLILVFGGTGYPFGSHVTNHLYVLNLKTLHWKRIQLSARSPVGVYGASMIIREPYLYILCGTNTWIYNTDVYEVHLPTLICRQIGTTFDEIEDPDNTGRYRQEAFLHGNRIFLFGGGGVSGISYSMANLPVFDLETKNWSFLPTIPDPMHNFPTPRKFHSIFPIGGNQILMFGGAFFDENTLRHNAINECLWTFDFNRLKWTALDPLRLFKPTYFHAADMNSRGEIWMHGGVVMDDDGDDHENRESRTTSLYMMHTRVSSLSEICWNRFLDQLADRSILLKQPDLLNRLHLPRQFIERIH